MKRAFIITLKVLLVCAVLGAGVFFLLKKSPEQKAFDASLALAKQGDAAAQAKVAAAYLAGDPVKQDAAQAVDWYLKSAAQGYAPGSLPVGILLHGRSFQQKGIFSRSGKEAFNQRER